jgi:hypothetical protein
VPHFSFTSPTGGEPITFDLNGVTYHCRERLPAGTALDMAAGIGDQGTAARRVGEFFDAVLLPEDAELFAAAIRDPDRPVPMETVTAIVAELMPAYTGRPTGPSPDSGDGRRITALTSTGDAS